MKKFLNALLCFSMLCIPCMTAKAVTVDEAAAVAHEYGYTDDEIEEKLNEKAEDNPKNAVFVRDDFKPEYIDMLRKDQELLDEMWLEWECIDDDDDSKFAKFEDLKITSRKRPSSHKARRVAKTRLCDDQGLYPSMS